MRTTLSMHHIARIEGHGNISLSIEDGRVSDVKMNVVEPARLFESMVGGRPFTQTSYIASRICGICSSSHVITDLLAIEQIFGVKTSERTARFARTARVWQLPSEPRSSLVRFCCSRFRGARQCFLPCGIGARAFQWRNGY